MGLSGPFARERFVSAAVIFDIVILEGMRGRRFLDGWPAMFFVGLSGALRSPSTSPNVRVVVDMTSEGTFD